MSYWVSRGGQKYGPYTSADVQRMIATGHILPTDFTWCEGMPQWAPVAEIFLSAAAVPPPRTAPAASYAAPEPDSQLSTTGRQAFSPRIPPALSWAVVLVLGMVTLGIFALVWLFVEANFVKTIDRRSSARTLLLIGLVLIVIYPVLGAALTLSGGGRGMNTVAALGMVFAVANAACWIAAIFKMRASLLRYYNSTEPINLRLSVLMTLFFNIYYFQYHFTRIAQWKKTGTLIPQ